MRAGTLHEDFTLTSEVFQELVTRINAISEFAAEIEDNEILLILASSGKLEIDGLLSLARVCCDGKKRSDKDPKTIPEVKEEGLLDFLEAIEE